MVHGNLYLEIAGERQHTGHYESRLLAEKIQRCLETHCAGGDGCAVNKECRVEGVCYNDRGKEKCDGHLKVIITHAWFVGGKKSAVIQALVRLIADTYGIQTEDKKNCWRETFDKDTVEWCNVSEQFYVQVSGGAGVHATLNTLVRFGGPAEYPPRGPLDCFAIKEATLRHMQNDVTKWLADAYKMPHFDPFISCRR